MKKMTYSKMRDREKEIERDRQTHRETKKENR